MALNETQQFQHLIDQSKHILIALKKNPTGDAISASLACALFLEKMNKHVDVVSDNFVLPKKFSFLKKSHRIHANMPHLQKFIIHVDVTKMGLQEFSYDVKNGMLDIFLTPNHGFFTDEHIRTAQTGFRYDLIITLDTPDFDSLGDMYHNNTDLFYKVPVMNIDASATNEHYGTVNLIHLTSSSTSETLALLFKQMRESLIDADIATALLTGMISATQSFKTKNVKPQALTLASELVGSGAEREFIIEHLYRTKTLSTLKLWGIALAHLEYHAALGLVCVTLTREDFLRSGAQETDLYDIVDELILNSPESKLVLLVHEKIDTPGIIEVILRSSNGHDAKQLVSEFSPNGDKKQVSFTVTKKSLKEVQNLVQEAIQKKS